MLLNFKPLKLVPTLFVDDIFSFCVPIMLSIVSIQMMPTTLLTLLLSLIIMHRKLFREILSALHKYIHFHVTEEKGLIKDVNHHLDMLWNEYM